jgi:hypothetical protein
MRGTRDVRKVICVKVGQDKLLVEETGSGRRKLFVASFNTQQEGGHTILKLKNQFSRIRTLWVVDVVEIKLPLTKRNYQGTPLKEFGDVEQQLL